MDKNDLRHYAETIIASIEKADEEFGTSYTSRPDGYMGLMEAYELAEAYISEHDPTPLDEDWMLSVGFARYSPIGISILAEGFARIAVIDLGGDGEHWSVQGFSLLRRAYPKTRGEVRQLCKVLGIPLSETPDKE